MDYSDESDLRRNALDHMQYQISPEDHKAVYSDGGIFLSSGDQTQKGKNYQFRFALGLEMGV